MTDMTPRRNATQDANEGIVEPSYASKTARVTAVKRSQPSDLEGATESFAESFGTMAKKFIDEEAKNRTEQAELNGRLRQGNETAINQISEDKKRGVVMSKIFGQDVEYRAAQQRAVKNNVRNMYNEQFNKVDEFSGETPDRYQLRLKDQLDDVLKDHQDDPETAKMVADVWSEGAEKLATQQFKNHYAYNQQQQRATAVNELRILTDSQTLEAQAAASPDELAKIHEKAKSVYAAGPSPYKDYYMSDSVWTEIRQENIVDSLKKGTIGPLNLAKSVGFTENYKPEAAAKLQEGINKYDELFQQDVYNKLDVWELDAMRLPTVEDVDDYIDAAQAEVNNQSYRKSGTEKFDKVISQADLDLEKMRKRVKLAVAGKKVKQNRYVEWWKAATSNQISSGLNVFKPRDIKNADGTTTVSEKFSKKEKEDGANYLVQCAIATGLNPELNCNDPTAVEEALPLDDVPMQLLQNPQALDLLAKQYKSLGIKPAIISNTFDLLIKSAGGMHYEGENGEFTEEMGTAITSLSRLAGSNLASNLGDNYANFKHLQTAVLTGKTVAQYNKEVEALKLNPADSAGVQGWGNNSEEGESKRDFLKKKIKGWTNYDVSPQQLSDLYRNMDEGMRIFNNDTKAALSYVKDIALSKSTKLGGQFLPEVDKDFNNDLADVVQWTGETAFLAPDIQLGTGALQNAPTSLDDIRHKHYSVSPDGRSLIVNAVSLNQPIVISMDKLRFADEQLQQSRDLEQLAEINRMSGYGRAMYDFLMGTDSKKKQDNEPVVTKSGNATTTGTNLTDLQGLPEYEGD